MPKRNSISIDPQCVARLVPATLALIWTSALGQQTPKQDLRQLDIEDLMKVEVTTESKSAKALSDVPAAVYVITQEDIRRSGAVTIPEALRLAPGVEVSQVNASDWMISIRGFNGLFADKLLVLMDGRTVYSPLRSGVYWDAQDTPLEDVDRIEVIRGPGGSVWGANAVNGIINIITKKAGQTQGSMLSTEFGTATELNTTYRYGGKLADDAFYRAYVKYLQSSGPVLPNGNDAPDYWTSAKTGFRIDGGKDASNRFTVIGDLQNEHITEQTLGVPPSFGYSATEADLLGRWERQDASGRSQAFQAYVDHFDRLSGLRPLILDKQDTVDIDYTTTLAPMGRHKLTLGAEYRYIADATRPVTDSITPANRKETLLSGFFRDEIDLSGQWKLFLGSKFENNSYTGFEIEPSAQLLYTPNPRQTYWASVSRAVRTPSGLDLGDLSQVPPPGPGQPTTVVHGNPNMDSESVLSHEIGSRFLLRSNAFLDLTAFYNRYEMLQSLELGMPYLAGNPPQPFLPVTFGNGIDGETAGFEAVLRLKPVPTWNLALSGSLFSEKFRFRPGSNDPSGLYDEYSGRGEAPRYEYQVQSNLDLPSHFEFDNDFYYEGALIGGNVPAYCRLDSRIGWNPSESWQLSLGVRNALTARHFESSNTLFPLEEVPRSFYFRAVVRF